MQISTYFYAWSNPIQLNWRQAVQWYLHLRWVFSVKLIILRLFYDFRTYRLWFEQKSHQIFVLQMPLFYFQLIGSNQHFLNLFWDEKDQFFCNRNNAEDLTLPSSLLLLLFFSFGILLLVIVLKWQKQLRQLRHELSRRSLAAKTSSLGISVTTAFVFSLTLSFWTLPTTNIY